MTSSSVDQLVRPRHQPARPRTGRTRALVVAIGALAFIVVAGSCSKSEPAGTAGSSTSTGKPSPATTGRPAVGTSPAASAGGLTLTSTAFGAGAPIPAKYTCKGENVSPPLAWTGVPARTASVAIVMVDPDAPVKDGFTHWVIGGLDPGSGGLGAGVTKGSVGTDSGYFGPCPPQGDPHHYVFTIYAFDSSFDTNTTNRAAFEINRSKALATAELVGTFQVT